MSRLLFEARAAVLACEAQQALIEKEIKLEKLKQQRKPWVGLEPQDFDGVIKSDAFEAGAYWANNILREKNA